MSTVFPQSDDCGLIEAIVMCTGTSSTALFPQSDDCGLIEAYLSFRATVPGSLFPQSDDCGLIEARSLELAQLSIQGISAVG